MKTIYLKEMDLEQNIFFKARLKKSKSEEKCQNLKK